MFDYLLITLIFFSLFMSFMAIGVMMGKKPLKGSCGGLNNVTNEKCGFCGKLPENCENKSPSTT